MSSQLQGGNPRYRSLYPQGIYFPSSTDCGSTGYFVYDFYWGKYGSMLVRNYCEVYKYDSIETCMHGSMQASKFLCGVYEQYTGMFMPWVMSRCPTIFTTIRTRGRSSILSHSGYEKNLQQFGLQAGMAWLLAVGAAQILDRSICCLGLRYRHAKCCVAILPGGAAWNQSVKLTVRLFQLQVLRFGHKADKATDMNYSQRCWRCKFVSFGPVHT